MLMAEDTMNVAIAGQAGNPAGCYYMDVFGSMVTGSANDAAAAGNGRMSAEDASGTNFYEMAKRKGSFDDTYAGHNTIGNDQCGDNENQGKRDPKHDNIKGTAPESKVITKKPRTAKGHPNHDLVSNKSDVFVSKNVFKRLSTQYGDTGKRMVRKSKSRNIQSTTSKEKVARLEAKEAGQEKDTKSFAKKLGASTLRRLMMSPSHCVTNSSSDQGKQVTVYKVAADDDTISKGSLSNKADNNNRMFEREGTGFFSKGLSIPTFHSMSRVTSFKKPSLIQSSEALCGVCSLKNCKSSVCKGLKGIIETNKKEFTLKRADSSDDSGCFSNLSRQSTNLQNTSIPQSPENESQAIQYEYDANEVDSAQNSGADPRAIIVCSVCGNEAHRQTEGLCKNCWNRYQKESGGTLDEFKSYAQSLATSVKNILAISSNASQTGDEGTIAEPMTRNLPQVVEDVPSKSNPDAVLHRFKSEVPILHPEESRSKGTFNRSMSLDITYSPSNGNVIKTATSVPGEELDIKNSNSLVSLDDGKQSKRNNFNKLASIGEESSGKEKIWLTSDDDRSTRSEREERAKRRAVRGKSVVNLEREKTKINPSSSDLAKNFNPATGRYEDQPKNPVPNPRKSKFLSRVERARTDGDFFAREGSAKKPETKKGDDSPKPPVKAVRTSVAETTIVSRPSKQEKENINHVQVSTLHVRSEGTPVDPPNGPSRKRSRTSLQRSATAPYKNPKKDAIKEKTEKVDKPSPSGSLLKVTRSATKIAIKTNKASALRKENSMRDRERANPLSDVLREIDSKGSPRPIPRKRSTSCDGSESFQMHPRLTDVRTSRSRSANNDDNDRGKTSKNESSFTYSPVPARRTKIGVSSVGLAAAENRVKSTATKTYTNNDYIMNLSSRKDVGVANYEKTDYTDKEVTYEGPRASIVLDQAEMKHKSSYYEGGTYHSTLSEEHLPAIPETAIALHHQREAYKDTESYFDDVDPFAADNSLVGTKNAQHFMSAIQRDASFDKDADGHTVSLRTGGEDSSQWYTTIDKPSNDDRALLRRDRSHESKSSTSFHNAMTVIKSSHSDVALRRPLTSENSCRRSNIYSESDVDTGLIYHVSKRTTTRAHVPPYHDLTTGAYKGLFTGDVSTSASSNSGFSNKSEGSDVYTGGFFKNDPFYDNDKGQSSSASSCSQLYFEPDGAATKKEPSLDDIYTGGIFSTSQNALALNNNSSDSYDILKNGSSNNSTRPPVHRMSRRSRCRPRIDAIMERGLETRGDSLEKPAMYFSRIGIINCSNNSNNWLDNFDFKNMKEQEPLCPTVVQNDEPVYTDYDSGVHATEMVGKASGTGFDISKYGIKETSNTGFFFSSPTLSKGNDDVWYQSSCDPNQCYERGHAKDSGRAPQTWSQRSWKEDAKCDKNNNNKKRDSSASALDSNNNHNVFEDFYTGEYKTNSPPVTPEPPTPRYSSSGDLYETIPPKFASGNFQDQDYTSGGSRDSPRERHSPLPHETPGHHSPSGLYEQTNQGYSGYGLYDTSSGRNSPWDGYSQTDGRTPSPMSSRYDDRQGKANKEERDSYFDFTSSQSPDGAGFMGDDDLGYTFDPSEIARKSPTKPIVKEIRKVGSIVCRDDVANKEDYAENVNRDLLDEPGAWVPFTYMHEEEKHHPSEMGGSRSAKRDFFGAAETSGVGSLANPSDESHYAHNRFYDSIGPRTNWRELNQSRPLQRECDGDSKKPSETKEKVKRKTSPHSSGDHTSKKTSSKSSTDKPAKKIDDYPNRSIWRPQDVIPERARGNRSFHSSTKTQASPAVQEPSDFNGNSGGNPAQEEQKHPSPPRPKPTHNTDQTEIPKWRKVVIEYPKPRPKKPPVQAPQEKPPAYESTVILQDEMIFISAKKVEDAEGTDEEREGNLEPLQTMENPFKPSKKKIRKTNSAVVEEMFHEKHPKLVPSTCIPAPRWVLLDTSPRPGTLVVKDTQETFRDGEEEIEMEEIVEGTEEQAMVSESVVSAVGAGKQLVATKTTQGKKSDDGVISLVKTTVDESERERYLILNQQLVKNTKVEPMPLRKRQKRPWKLPKPGTETHDAISIVSERSVSRTAPEGAGTSRASMDSEKIVSKMSVRSAQSLERDSKTSKELIDGQRDTKTSKELIDGQRDSKPSKELIDGQRDTKTSKELIDGQRDSKTSEELIDGQRDSKTSEELIDGQRDTKTSKELITGTGVTESTRAINETGAVESKRASQTVPGDRGSVLGGAISKNSSEKSISQKASEGAGISRASVNIEKSASRMSKSSALSLQRGSKTSKDLIDGTGGTETTKASESLTGGGGNVLEEDTGRADEEEN